MNNRCENTKYKLLGFENNKGLAVVMVISTGRVIKIRLVELLNSEVMDDLNKKEVRDVYRKHYSGGVALTAYELNDRHERSWMVYVVLNLILLTLYVFSNIAAAKLIYLERFDLVLTPGVFLYPLTFLVVDLLNESYGLRLARKAILFAFAGNACIIIMLSAVSHFPGMQDWKLDSSYNDIVTHISSVLLASSISFLFSEYVNSYLLFKIKELTNSRFLFLRVFLSTFFAVIIDTLLFCSIAFYGVMNNSDLINMMILQVSIKMLFAVFNVLPAYGARSVFKRVLADVPIK